MIKKIFSLFSKTEVPTNKQPYDDVISNDYYEIVTRHIVDSKYCNISSDEEMFLKYLLYKLHQSNQKPYIQLKRMSTKAIDVSYNGYPIGKIKLQGKKTWMQILTGLYDQERLDNSSLEEYVDAIELWIVYIKKLKVNK